MLPAPRLIRWIGSLALFLLIVMTLLRGVIWLELDRENLRAAQAGAAFWLGLRFDLRVVASAMLPLLVLGSFRLLHPFEGALGRRLWLSLLGVFGTGLLVFYASDYLHYQYLQQRLNASVLGFLGDARISAGMVWQSYPVVRLTLGILVALGGFLVAAAALLRRAARVPPEARRSVRVAWFSGALVLCLIGIWGRLGQYPLRWSDAFNLRNDALANLALNPVQSFLSTLDFRSSGHDAAKVREHYAAMSTYLGVTKPDPDRLSFMRHIPGRADAGADRPNVIVVICESFSGYKSSMWGNPLDPTPFFNELCQQGLFFDNCFTPHFGTARGIWATLTGIPDVVPVETASRNPALVDQHTIINDFVDHEKFYFIGGSSSWANIRGLLTNNIRGLKLYEEGSFEAPRIDVWGISDKNLFLEADRILRGQTKPFFAVIQTADNHRPYTIPKEDLQEFTKVEVPAGALKQSGFESLAELNAFRYTDYAFRKFLEAARQSPYFDRTIFVFIGDHGIGGDAGRMLPPAWTENDLTSYHVPLLFYGPRYIAPQRIHAVASMVDLLPTLAGIVGIPYRNAALGRDLRRQQEIDGGRSNAAFIIDHANKWVGLLKGQAYARQQGAGARREWVWADFGATPPAAGMTGSCDEHLALAQAFHETAKYMLLHNKKPDAAKGAEGRHPPKTE